jgi:alpha-tubulin suppressor-like RCC1 family protein
LGGLEFAQVSAGWNHTCGVTTANVGYCWGYNDYGRLGDDTYIQRETPNPVFGNLLFTEAHATYLHSCGLTTGHEPYCWAYNGNGRLGDGSTVDSRIPVQVVH